MRIVKPITVTSSNLLSSTVAENDYAVYSPSTSYTLGQKVIVLATHKVYESLRGGSSTVVITQATPAVIGWRAHGLPVGTAVTFSSTGTLPAPLTAGTKYYVVNPQTDTFNVSTTLNGSALATTSAGSGTFTCFDTPNLGNDPATTPSQWLDSGTTNKFRLFDQSVQSQTTATTSFSYTVQTISYFDTLAFLNVNASSITVTVTANGSQVYNKTIQLITNAQPVVNLWTYFFSGFKTVRDVIIDDIPPYAVATLTFTFNGVAGATVGCGCAIIGSATDISSTGLGVESGAKVGIDDYSIKTRDDFGNYTILERAFNKRADFTVYIESSSVDEVQNLLSDLRATPVLYLGSRNYKACAIYGFYKSFDIEIAYQTVSVCTISLSGLT